jgi:uncharacterized protein YacL
MTSLWAIRLFFLSLCMLGGFAVSQLHNALVAHWGLGLVIGFGLGSLLIALDEMLKGFSLRAFSAATFGLLLGSLIAWLIDNSQLFEWALPDVRWLIRVGLFLSFSYIGIILAMRSNKEDFYLIIPYVRFTSQGKPERPLVLDTSAIIDGRIADLIEGGFVEGLIIVPRFVLRELQAVADSADPIKRARGRRGLEIVQSIQQNKKNDVKIHEGDFPEEPDVDAKLLRLSRTLQARLYTTDYNLGKIAEIQAVPFVNITDLASRLKPAILPGETLSLRLVREGKEKDQAVGYLGDGTMVVVNQARGLIGQQAQVQVLNLVQTGAGVIVFADLRNTPSS